MYYIISKIAMQGFRGSSIHTQIYMLYGFEIVAPLYIQYRHYLIPNAEQYFIVLLQILLVFPYFIKTIIIYMLRSENK